MRLASGGRTVFLYLGRLRVDDAREFLHCRFVLALVDVVLSFLHGARLLCACEARGYHDEQCRGTYNATPSHRILLTVTGESA
jgi:hypothetical protein